MDRLGLVSVLSSQLALAAAGLTIDDVNRERVGVVLGTGIGPMDAMETFSRPVLAEGAKAASPAVFPNTVYNAAAGQVAINLGTVGPTTTLTSGHAAGAAAINYAAALLSTDQADALLAIGADTLTHTVIAAYDALGLLGDDGFALAEAGVAILLERRSAMIARGAEPLGEVLSHADTSDARGTGRWDPDGRGLERAMRSAIQRAGLESEDVGTVWSSMTGHRSADAAERSALGRVFGTGRTRILSPRLGLGEPVGAGGPLGVALAVTGWRKGWSEGPVLVNSSSFGGSHVCTVLAPAAASVGEVA